MIVLNFFNLYLPNNYNFFKIFKLNILLFTIFILIIIVLFFFIIIIYFLHRKYIINYLFFFKNNFFIEIIIFNIYFFIIIYITILSTNILINIKNNLNSDIIIKIISFQWKWYINYLKILNKNNKKISFFSNISTNIYEIINYIKKNKYYINNVDNNLIIPNKKKIRFIFSSNDVIHSLYIPSINIKQDLLPGFLRSNFFYTLKKGKYRGYCTELCGKNHNYMPINIKIISFFNYKKWILSKIIQKLINNKF